MLSCPVTQIELAKPFLWLSFQFGKWTITIIPSRQYMRKTGVCKEYMQQNRINTELTEEFTAELISVLQN